MFSTGKMFSDTLKNKVFLRLYEVFTSLGQWFIKHCDMEDLVLTEEEIEQFGNTFLKNIDELAEIDES